MKKLSLVFILGLLIHLNAMCNENVNLPKDSLKSQSSLLIDSKGMPEVKFYRGIQDLYMHQWALYKQTNNNSFVPLKLTSYQGIEDTLTYDFGKSIGSYKVCLEPNLPSILTDTICRNFEVSNNKDVIVSNVLMANCHILTTQDSGYHQLEVLNAEKFHYFKLEIFNRWGEMVFNTNNSQEHWCGKHIKNMEMCPNGVYFYIVEYGESKTETQKFNGVLTLIVCKNGSCR
jgi:gliding motility-associated-like protein